MWNEIKAKGTTRPTIDPKMGAIVPATGNVWLWLARQCPSVRTSAGLSVLWCLSGTFARYLIPFKTPHIVLVAFYNSRPHFPNSPWNTAQKTALCVSCLTGRIGVVAPSARDETAFVPLPVSAAELQLRGAVHLRLGLYSYTPRVCTRGPVMSGRNF
jgi:hypothetical protein